MINKQIANEIINCYLIAGTVFVIGNGGSASMSNHFAGEFVNKMFHKRKALSMISLCSDIAVITAIANDSDFKYIFSRQLEALAKSGDILITLSTSGKSANILEAIKTAKRLNMRIISFPTNKETGKNTPKTQEIHLKMIHKISELVENKFL